MEQHLKKISLLGLMLLLSPFVWLVSAAPLQEEAMFLRHTENGPIIVYKQGFPHTNIFDRLMEKTNYFFPPAAKRRFAASRSVRLIDVALVRFLSTYPRCATYFSHSESLLSMVTWLVMIVEMAVP